MLHLILNCVYMCVNVACDTTWSKLSQDRQQRHTVLEVPTLMIFNSLLRKHASFFAFLDQM